MIKYNNMESLLPSAKDQFKLFLENPIFFVCIFSWFSAQFLKTVINLIHGRIKSLGELLEMMIFRTGGMPSSHSALVTSLCVTIGFRNGLNSDIFIFSFCFFMVVIRDAFGVRRSSGIQAKKINQIGKELNEKKLLNDYKPIKEVNGHTPMEVIFGCILGGLVGVAFSVL